MERQAQIDTQLNKLDTEVKESYGSFKDDVGELVYYDYQPFPLWLILIGGLIVIYVGIRIFRRNE